MTRLRLLLLCSALALGLGCEPPEVPETLHYRLQIGAATEDGVDRASSVRRLRRFFGAALVVGDRSVGRLGGNGRGLVASFSEPSSVRPSQIARDLGVRLETPCGPRTVPLPAPQLDDDADSDEAVGGAMARGSIELETTLLAPDFRRTRLYLDRGSAAGVDIRVGELTLEDWEEQETLRWLDCESDVEVRVGDAVVGSLRPRDAATFVSADPELCHRLATVRYGETVAREPLRSSRGLSVQGLDEDVNYFLREAPEAIDDDQRDRTRTELIVVSCDELPQEPAAGEL